MESSGDTIEIQVEEGGGGAADPLPHILGASGLGVAGLALLGIGAGSFAAGSCDFPAADGGCAFGSPTDEPAALGLTIAGAVAVVGAIVWLIVGLAGGGDEAEAAGLRFEGGRLEGSF